MYEVRHVADDSEVAALARMVAHNHGAAMESDAPGTCYPALGVLRNAPHLFAAYFNDRPVAAAVISERGQGGWFSSHPDHVAEAGVAIMAAVGEHLGMPFWGQVHSDELCAAFVAASNGCLVADDDRNVRWVD